MPYLPSFSNLLNEAIKTSYFRLYIRRYTNNDAIEKEKLQKDRYFPSVTLGFIEEDNKDGNK